MKTNELIEFLYQSNLIEDEHRAVALVDSISAWTYMEEWARPNDLTLKDILNIHEYLMYHIDPRIAGKLRGVNVRVGSSIRPDHTLVYGLINELLREPAPKTEEDIRQWHIKFEEIHPFDDGNGRCGRIIYQWQRKSGGLPIHIIYAKDKDEYYKWFRG